MRNKRKLLQSYMNKTVRVSHNYCMESTAVDENYA